MKVVIYGADWCKPCQNTKKLCKEQEFDFEFKDISVEPEALKEVTDLLGYKPKQIPQVFVDGKHIGGSTEFALFVQQLK